MLSFLAACGGSGQSSASAPVPKTLNSVTYGKGIFVTVGGIDNKPLVETSTDGISWSVQNADNDSTASMTQVVAGKNGFLAYGTSNSLFFSSDAINWANITSQFQGSPSVYSVTWDGSEYLVVSNSGGGSTGVIYESSDGSHWTSVTEQGSNVGIIRDIVKVAWKWYGIDDTSAGNDYVVSSTDLANWTDVLDPSNLQPISYLSLDYIGGQFIGINQDGLVGLSTDAMHWTTSQVQPNNSGGNITSFAGNGAAYVGVGGLDSAYIAYSGDGKTWNETDISKLLPSGLSESSFLAVTAQPNGAFVAVGSDLGTGVSVLKPLEFVSMDGIHWSVGNP